MVTAASSADAAVVLVDATKLDWARSRPAACAAAAADAPPHAAGATCCACRRSCSPSTSSTRWKTPTLAFEQHLAARCTPSPQPPACRSRPSCRSRRSRAGTWSTPPARLVRLRRPEPAAAARAPARRRRRNATVPFAFPVQWVEKFSASADTSQGRRVFWGRVATGHVAAGPARHGAAQRPDRHGGAGARPRAPAAGRARRPQRRHRARPRGRRVARRLAAGARRLRAVARDLRHRRLARRRAAGGRAASTGRCTATAGSRPRSSASSHRLNINTLAEHDADAAGAQRHRPRRAGAAGAAGHAAVSRVAHAGLAGAGGHRQPQDRRGRAGSLNGPTAEPVRLQCTARRRTRLKSRVSPTRQTP